MTPVRQSIRKSRNPSEEVYGTGNRSQAFWAARWLALAAVGFLFAGCRNRDPETFSISLESGSTAPARVRFQGEVVYERAWGGHEVVPGRSGPYAVQGATGHVAAGGITVESLTPDGWRDTPFEAKVWVPPDKKDRNRELYYPPPDVHLMLQWAGTITLYVDNREHGEVLLACGRMTIPVSRDAVSTFRFTPPRSADNTAILWNGKEIGRIADFEGMGDPHRKAYLIDTSGRRKYRLKTIHYGYDNSKPGKTVDYPSGFFRETVSVDHFLEGAPDSVFTQGMGASRSIIYEIDPQ